jgi:hypothetical protein
MSKFGPYGWTHDETCIEYGHCLHHIDRLDLLVCCVCKQLTPEDKENDCA